MALFLCCEADGDVVDSVDYDQTAAPALDFTSEPLSMSDIEILQQ